MAKEIFKTRERMILVMKWDNLIILQEVLNDLGVTYIADRFIDSRLDAEESEEFVREVVRDELERKE